ncbi:hypothetical protein RsTz2092_03470 [Deferribacterales bacterium RsTz2092]|nr:hypothetical protein AGMMS49941_11820 [Deferribacterales bacterium]
MQAHIDSVAGEIRYLDELARADSPIHRLSAMSKLITTLVYVVSVISVDRYNISGLIPFATYPIVIATLSDTPFRVLLPRLAVPFVIFAGLSTLLFNRDIYGLTISSSIIIKSLLTVSSVVLLIATTPIYAISTQLSRLKVPQIFTMAMLMTYRYVLVLLDEVALASTAYRLRSPAKNKGIALRDIGSFLGQLLLRSLGRAERVYAAMKCRAFDGTFRYKTIDNPSEIRYIVPVCLAIILLRITNISLLVGNLFLGFAR